MLTKKDLEERARTVEDKLYKIKQEYETANNEIKELISWKNFSTVKLEEREQQIAALNSAIQIATNENSSQADEYLEKIAEKNNVLEGMIVENRQLKSTVKM